MLLQGSTSGLLLVLRFYHVDLELVMVWSCQCTFQSPSSNFSVWFWVVFFGYVGWFFWWDFPNYGLCFGGYIFWPEIGICMSLLII